MAFTFAPLMPIEFKDYYATLGVPRDASEEDIKKAFRKLAREHHPDAARNKQTAEEKCKAIGVACELVYPGAPDVKQPKVEDYLIATLKAVRR